MAKLIAERWRDVAAPTDQNYLIENWYDRGTMVVTYGESNVGKSNLVLSQSIAIAEGAAWDGHRTHQGLVLYVALEGGRGFRRRIVAYKTKYPTKTSLPFVLVRDQVDMLNDNDVKELIDLIRKEEAAFGQKCEMIVIDTLSRAMPGSDENSARDMTTLVSNCDRIRKETGAAAHLVHHSGKKQASGARGHSSLRGATDTEIEVTTWSGQRMAEVTKQRDLEQRAIATFDYEIVEIGNVNGIPVNSIVTIVPGGTATAQTLSAKQTRVLLTLRDLVFAQAGITPKDPANFDRTEVTSAAAAIAIATSDLRRALNIVSNARAKKAFERVVTDLKADGFIDVQRVGRDNQLRLRP
jgi:RecA-family ATPase